MTLKALGVAALLSFLPYQALAGPVTLNIDSVTGVWTSASGAAVGGIGTNQISWGTPLGASQSSYVFDGVAPPTQGPFSAGDDFTLGTFTHNNFPIAGSAITGATLEVTIMGTAQNGSSENFNLTSTFDFDHFETPNGANPCAAGGVSPCPDLVTPTLNLLSSETITIDGTEFVFDVTGFEVGGMMFTSFLTAEGLANSASLVGSFSEVAKVPLPAALPMLAGSLGLLGYIAARRRRRTEA